MKLIPLGARQVPAIGLGTYKMTGPAAVDVIKNAIRIGYRHIDTAQLYDNEREVGRAIRESGIDRHNIFLTTKVWPSNLGKERFLPSVKESLAKLGLENVDLLLVHWPHHQLPVEEYITRMMEVRDMGLTTEIGVSNFNISQLKVTIHAGASIVTNQVEFHPWINQTKLRAFMNEHKIPLTAYCPLGQGKLLADKRLEELAAKYLHSPAQIVLRWMMHHENILAIPKSTNNMRLKENLNIFDFELDQKEIEMIDAWRLGNTRIVGAQAGAEWDK